MKVAIVGSRTFDNYDQLIETLDNLRDTVGIDEIISGGARGADALAEQYASEYEIKMTVIKPDWNRYGKAAGMLRNTDIVAASDIVVAFWDGRSRGTADSIKKAKAMGKSLIVVKFD